MESVSRLGYYSHLKLLPFGPIHCGIACIIALFRLSVDGFHLTSSFSPARVGPLFYFPLGFLAWAHASVQIRNPDAPIDRIVVPRMNIGESYHKPLSFSSVEILRFLFWIIFWMNNVLTCITLHPLILYCFVKIKFFLLNVTK